ncbi:CBO0543 family protein [uncultured Metabacillus sp.]|uniref:CBO0543 family protein n=1 Tax=uncultured Metabacillus sp. TaxID=2860135 RepID=UPI002616D75A|nr:CBO0543 family protein [uncultured Metabacillus sp.]
MIILPLVILYFTIDRRRIFQLGFYGFNIHVWSIYLDAFASRFNYLGYPYKAIPYLPINFGIDTSLVPVLFILVYQWTVEKKKQFYLYTLVLIIFISFIFRPLSVGHNLFRLHQGANYVHLFIGYIVITAISICITNLFLYMKNHPKGTHK